MILAVALNAAVDKTVVVSGFKLDARHYASSTMAVPGGKAINVARVLHELGSQTRVLGYGGGHHGAFISEGLHHEGIPCSLVHVHGESRMCLTIVDPGHSHTEVNEMGPTIPQAAVEALLERYLQELAGSQVVVLSGSVPPGVPDDFYARCITMARERQVPAVLDAKGRALALGLAARPQIVKPNREELSGLLERSIASVDQAVAATGELHERGAEIVLVSLGEDGLVASDGSRCIHASLSDGPVLSPVGSGDSLVAAFLWGREHGESFERCAALGVAAGLANAMVLGAGFCKKPDILRLAERVVLKSY
ncbi:MAG: 1-phosphofructokinase family hexose kinase [Candidatus Xenobia bacterium]